MTHDEAIRQAIATIRAYAPASAAEVAILVAGRLARESGMPEMAAITALADAMERR